MRRHTVELGLQPQYSENFCSSKYEKISVPIKRITRQYLMAPWELLCAGEAEVVTVACLIMPMFITTAE